MTWNLFAVEDLGAAEGPWAQYNDAANAYFVSEGADEVPVPPGHSRVILAADHEGARYLVAMVATDRRESQSACYDCQSGQDLHYADFETWLADIIEDAQEFIADELEL